VHRWVARLGSNARQHPWVVIGNVIALAGILAFHFVAHPSPQKELGYVVIGVGAALAGIGQRVHASRRTVKSDNGSEPGPRPGAD
jgi:hypothetical protein